MVLDLQTKKGLLLSISTGLAMLLRLGQTGGKLFTMEEVVTRVTFNTLLAVGSTSGIQAATQAATQRTLTIREFS